MGQPAHLGNRFRVLTYQSSFLQQKNIGAPTKIKSLWPRLIPLEPVFRLETRTFLLHQKSPINPADPLNPEPSLVLSQVLKYTKDNLLQIFKIVWEAQSFTAYSHDWITFKALPKRDFKPRTPDVYKGKSHIDCHKFIR